MRALAVTFVVVAGLAGAPAADAASWTVRSPDGGVTATVVQDAALRLDVRRGGAHVLSSELGIEGVSPAAFAGRGDRVVDDRFVVAAGKRRAHRLLANEMTLDFGRLQVVVRAARDGVAYRYVLPGSGEVEITGERSAFRARADTRAWLLPWRSNYENHFEALRLEAAPPRIYGFPALLRVGGTWALIAESDVDGRYGASQMTVSAERPGVLAVTLPQPSVRSALPLATPWRVAVVGDLETVVESDLVTDLGSPSQVGDAGWIRPGTVAWSWWSDGGSPRDFERQKDFVDYAASVGWRYVLVDEGWSPEWMPELVRYAAARGVEVIVWSRWDDLETQAERDALLPLWKSWGVAGVKADFMNSDTQEMMRWYDAIARDTARHELLLNLHGATPPRGIQRTWPHVLTLEGVRGAEDYNLGFLTPVHNVTLPFTRNVIGSMDYTPVTFSADRRETSAGHELALAVVYESGLQHPADSVESYSSRGVAEAFLERVPAAWDESELVGGFPGREATFARRSGDWWFVGSIVAGGSRTISVPLDFLPRGRAYTAEVVRDERGGDARGAVGGHDRGAARGAVDRHDRGAARGAFGGDNVVGGADDLVVERRRVVSGDRLRVRVPRDGGFAAVLCAAERCLDQARLARLRVATERRFVAAGGTIDAHVTLTNRSERTLDSPRVALSVPSGWRARPDSELRWPALAPGASRTATWSVSSSADAAPAFVARLKATASYVSGGRRMDRMAPGELTVRPSAPPSGDRWLSDLDPFNSFNSLGPLERDTSNGGGAAGDGRPITIAGQTFAKGLGGAAHSEQAYYLGGRCSRLDAVVGVDDEVGSAGTIVFQVWGDDVKLFDSGRLTGDDPGRQVRVRLDGVEELKLLMGDSGDHTEGDHGDWAGARVRC